MKIVILDGYTLNPGDLSWQGLEKHGQLKVYDRTSYNKEDKDLIIERGKDADVIFTNKTPLTREILNSMPNLKYIGILATGYDVVDVEAARDKGIIVTNIPSYGTTAVAQMTLALILELTNHVGQHSAAVFNGEWESNPDWCFWKYPMMELAGKTLGIIGYGRIGQEVGKIAKAFNMEVLAYGRTIDDKVYKESDFISLHCPLTEDNKEMINKETLSKMKKSAFLINTSRGGLVNEEDLASALNNRTIAGAGLDVVSKEPISPDNPLLKAKNCIITPHISWAPIESRKRLLDMAIDNLDSFLKGNPINEI